MQLGHAGRKASTQTPHLTSSSKKVGLLPNEGGWLPVGASALSWDKNYIQPHELTAEEINKVVKLFGEATDRTAEAGYDIIELHGAHGYLLSSFFSPIANKRTDIYNGSTFEGRSKLYVEVVREIRSRWKDKPLFVRISCTDWYEEGIDIDSSVKLAALLKSEGVDAIDCSSGGNTPNQKIKPAPGFQVPFAERIRKEVQIPTIAVGRITTGIQANEIVKAEQADLIALASQHLADPYFALHAALELKVDVDWPVQHERAKPKL